MLTVIGGNPVNFLDQCTLDVGFKGITEVGWTEESIDRNEQFARRECVIVGKRANCDLGTQVDLLPVPAKILR